MPQSRTKPELEKNAFVLSASQLSTASLCKRKWWFEKVKRLPRLEKDYFTFGTVLHECIERFLCATITGEVPLPSGTEVNGSRYKEGIFKGQQIGEPVELFPKDWDTLLSAKESGLIRKLIAKAIEEGLIIRNLEQKVEHEFWKEIAKDVWITGFIDYRIPGELHDHKSTKSFRYALSPKGLQSNIQMLLYACIIHQEESELDTVLLRHNYFLKDPDNPSIRKVEATVSKEQLDEFWDNEVCWTSGELLYLRDNVTEWAEIDDPTTPGACSKYGGCAFQDICCGITTVEAYTTNIKAINANTPENKPFKGWGFDSLPKAPARDKHSPLPEETTDMSDILKNKLKQMREAEGTPIVDVEVLEEAEVPVEVLDYNPPPWVHMACTACHGAGWNKKGNPCGICVQINKIDIKEWELVPAGEGKMAWEDPEGNAGICSAPSTPKEVKVSEVQQLSAKISAPLTEPSKENALKAKLDAIAKKSMEPKEPEADNKIVTPVLEGIQTVSSDEVDETPKKKGRPKKAFTLAINCCPVRGTAKVTHLDQLFKDLSQQVAEAKGKSSYYELPAFERRDILAIKAEEIADHLGTDICLARPNSPDMNAFIDMLRPYASIVWEPMAGTTTVIEG